MTYLSSWKMPRDSNFAIHCYFHSCTYKKITHLTICKFSPPLSPSPSSSSSSSPSSSSFSSTSRKTNILSPKYSREKSLRNGNRHRAKSPISESTSVVSVKLKKLFGSKKLRSIILLNLICVVYASNIAVIKNVEAFTDPAYFSVVRFGVSAISFLPFVLQAGNDSHIRNSGLELGLWVSLGYLSEALGLVTCDAGRASFISLFTVILVPVIESMLGEIVPVRTWFGILMSVVGISMLECSGSPPNIGDLFNFLSAIFFGIHTLRTEHISRVTSKEHLLPLLGYEVCVVAILSTIWCMMGGNNDGTIPWSWSWGWFWEEMVVFPWIPTLYTGVFSTGLCLWGEIAAMRDVSASETAVIYGLEPVWGAGFAWFLLGERWGIAGWIGALLILGGSLSVSMLGASEPESRDENEASDKKTLSASIVMVKSSSRDNAMDILKK